jgi:hypothetical protein
MVRAQLEIGCWKFLARTIAHILTRNGRGSKRCASRYEFRKGGASAPEAAVFVVVNYE